MNGIVVKKGGRADRQAVKNLIDTLQRHEMTYHPSRVEPEMMEGNYDSYIFTNLEKKNGLCLIAYDGETPVGTVCGWVEVDDYIGLKTEYRAFGYVSEGFVHHDYRRKGVYSLLMKEIEDHFRQLGIRTMRTYCLADNPGVHNFNRTYGYKPYEIIYEKAI